MSLNTYEVLTDGWYMTGIGAVAKARGNADLTWEKTNSLNVAFDATMLENRLSVGFTYYDKKTIDLVNDLTIPLSTGFTSYKINQGQVKNIGYEFRASYAAIKTRDMSLNFSVNGARNEGTILKISDSQKAYNDSVVEYFESYAAGNINNTPILQFVEGGSLSSIYGVRSLGISPTNGEELFVSADGSVVTDWNAIDQTIIGNTEPILSGAFQINFNYKSFSFYTSFMYSTGGDVYNSTLANSIEGIDIYTRNVDLRVLTDRWKSPGEIAQFRKLSLKETHIQPTSRFVQNESYLKFNSFNISWTVEPKWLKGTGISMCRISASMNDVFTLSTIKQERGLAYPFARTFNLSANISF